MWEAVSGTRCCTRSRQKSISAELGGSVEHYKILTGSKWEIRLGYLLVWMLFKGKDRYLETWWGRREQRQRSHKDSLGVLVGSAETDGTPVPAIEGASLGYEDGDLYGAYGPRGMMSPPQ